MEHTHKYRRLRVGKNKYIIYKCVVLNCNHHKSEDMMIGTTAQCWYCPNIFVIETKAFLLAKPHCGCRWNVKMKEQSNKLDSFLSELGLKLE